jgi:hypothetical protein
MTCCFCSIRISLGDSLLDQPTLNQQSRLTRDPYAAEPQRLTSHVTGHGNDECRLSAQGGGRFARGDVEIFAAHNTVLVLTVFNTLACPARPFHESPT